MTTKHDTQVADKLTLTTSEAAKHFGVAKSTLRLWVYQGAPCELLDGRRSWPWRSIAFWLKGQNGELNGYVPTNNPRADYLAIRAMESQRDTELEMDYLIQEIRVRCLLSGWNPIRRDAEALRIRANFFRRRDAP